MLLAAAVASLALAGCAKATVPPPTPVSTGAAASDLAAEVQGTPTDAAIAASCAGVTITETTLHNARTDLELGAITNEQYNALLGSVVVAYRSLQTVPATQRGLKGEVNDVVSYLNSAEPTESLAPFDPDGSEFRAVTEPIRLACAENGSETYVFATTGG
ncbi:hypothetical protein AWU67_14465 [Microterricola viridarii]|uniref:Lipoprotein n=2 Tax=Microterricola viridarii TaxID=412690 RepID=A0A0Y0PJ26_9MICO|nr:hypothetical protein AWU67_14465 [Microterricola viridarii]